MARVKCTKIELVRLKKKLSLFQKYLPTLQLKKMLLQAEVNKAKEDIKRLKKLYEEERDLAAEHAHLLTDPSAKEMKRSLEIEELLLEWENIAGIQVPQLEKLTFKEVEPSLIRTPLWIDETIEIIRRLQYAYQRITVAIRKMEILQRELRVVSIRVNLFEKRLIPEL